MWRSSPTPKPSGCRRARSLTPRRSPSRYSNDFSARVLHIHYKGFAAVLDVDGGEARFIQRLDDDARRGGRQSIEVNPSFSLRVCRWILGSGWSPLRLTFAPGPSGDPAHYVEVPKAPVVFGAADDAVVVRRSDLDRQSEGHDPEILDFIERSLPALAGPQPLGFDERLARTIDTLLAMKSATTSPEYGFCGDLPILAQVAT